jgi:hypothetical protein
MSVSNQAVTSREYKLILNSDRFSDRDKGAEQFLKLIDLVIRKHGGTIVATQGDEEHRRTSYLDTPQFALHQNGFALRLRDEDAKGFQINLKYRDSDRYLSAAQDLSGSQKGKIKFEEDILPPFVSKFSHSNSIKTGTNPDFKKIKEVTSFFPGLAGLGLDPDTAVKTANDFTALEVVRNLCNFQFNGPEILKASLSFWYLGDEVGWPLISEFSFDYDAADKDESKLEQYSLAVVEGAKGVFTAIQNQTGWLDSTTTTKTGFALEVL